MERVEIMDTTLRDGEQTSGIAFKPIEKLSIAKILLEEVKVDRIEVASARISEGEFEAVKKITAWANKKGMLEKVEVLGFVDGGKSLEWISEAGAKTVNLLCKGSLHHLNGQLRKSPSEHLSDIRKTLKQAEDLSIEVNIYLEDWSNGMRNSPGYVLEMIEALSKEKVRRLMLPDTLGIITPFEIAQYFSETTEKYPDVHFDCHTHNDYDLSVANVMAALQSGAKGVHTTINGLGERSGNAPLASVVAMAHDQLKIETQIDEKSLYKISRMVEAFSGTRIPANKPIVGENVFTQTCGVHADGDTKGDLYVSSLTPERFGRERKYALGKTSGKASIRKNLEELGIELSPESMKKVTRRVVELGDKKEGITTEDLPYIIADVLGSEVIIDKIKILNYHVSHVHQLKPTATLSIEIGGKAYEATSTGDGQYDAFMKALKSIYKQLEKPIPVLTDYYVTIPPGGKTNALVETVITWEINDREFKTRGLDSDQASAAIKATLKMLNIIEG